MNMTFVHVRTTEDFFGPMFAKEVYIALGSMGTHYLVKSFLDSTNSYHDVRIRWYVPCSVKIPRWSSIFRILSVELWLVLIISILTASISTTINLLKFVRINKTGKSGKK
jgi:putative exporter of polyketide antibiotics